MMLFRDDEMRAGAGMVKTSFRPRPYQSSAVDEAIEKDKVAQKGVCIVSPTGTGKSAMMGMVAQERMRHGGVLILAGKEELVRKNAEDFELVTGERCRIEMNVDKLSAYDWQQVGRNGECVSASIATMQGNRLERVPWDAIKTVVVDEAHRFRPAVKEGAKTANGMLASIRKHFAGARLFGVTATYWRHGGKVNGKAKNDLWRVFDQVVQTGTLFDFIDAGWLVDVRCRPLSRIESTLDFSGISKTGIITEKQAEAIWTTHQLEAFAELRRGLIDYAGRRPTLVFSPSVMHAKMVAQALNLEREGIADYLSHQLIRDDGTKVKYPPDRRAALPDRMRRGSLQYVANQNVFTEGTDIDVVACIALCGATRSKNAVRQRVGRGTRTLKGVLDGLDQASAAERLAAISRSGKRDCLVLDFVGAVSKHGLADTMAIVADQGGWTEQKEAFAQQYLKEKKDKDEDFSMREMVKEVEERASSHMEAVRAILKAAKVEVKWEDTEINVRDGYQPGAVSMRDYGQKSPPTEKQVDWLLKLQKMHAPVKEWLDKSEIIAKGAGWVGKRIDALAMIRNAQPVQQWQRAQIRNLGIPDSKVPKVYGQAMAMIDKAKKSKSYVESLREPAKQEGMF